jgi:hypothetical protein
MRFCRKRRAQVSIFSHDPQRNSKVFHLTIDSAHTHIVRQAGKVHNNINPSYLPRPDAD